MSELLPGGTNGTVSKLHAIANLGAASMLGLILGWVIYWLTNVAEVKLAAITNVEAKVSHLAARLDTHANRDTEAYRLSKLQCRALLTLAKMDAERCELGGGMGAPF